MIPCRNDLILNKCGDYCCYCGVSINYGVGMHLPYYHDQGITDRPSIDRIVSSKGYIYDNVVISCDHCNSLKNDGPPWPYLINPYISDPKIKDYLKVILDNFPLTPLSPNPPGTKIPFASLSLFASSLSISFSALIQLISTFASLYKPP